jgi:hypothetical protein
MAAADAATWIDPVLAAHPPLSPWQYSCPVCCACGPWRKYRMESRPLIPLEPCPGWPAATTLNARNHRVPGQRFDVMTRDPYNQAQTPTQELLMDRVCLVQRDHLAVVSLARPDKYNGMDLDMMHGLVEAARQIRRQGDIRAVILRGEGPAFCSGLDFASVTRQPEKPGHARSELTDLTQACFSRFSCGWRSGAGICGYGSLTQRPAPDWPVWKRLLQSATG